ncbi:hypothetical protein BGX26_011269 [Mortierella sp. AD094]|nr:hypothetical protein BGX26_011269 [Mortierella sp. AD094]
MGACCGKPDRKSQGYVLGSSNTSSTASAAHPTSASATATPVAKSKVQPPNTAGHTLGGPSSPPPAARAPGELSASALAAQKRAEAAEKRGVQQGGGKLAKKLADQTKQSPFAVVEPMPEPTNTLTPMGRSIIATTRAVRNLLIFSTSSVALVYFLWSGTHAYLEQYKCPSPEGVSSMVKNCLHGAWVREEISPDPDVAEVYFQKALELARKDLETFYRNKNKDNNKSDSYIMISDETYLEIEKDEALVEIQNRLARFYGRIGQDERAATIWTRLWKLSEKNTLRVEEESKSSSGLLGSLFGSSAERPLITKQDGIPFAKQAADSWMRLGEYDLAEEALGWTLSAINSSSTSEAQQLSDNSSTTIEQVGLFSTLGALYVRQSKFEYALSLFVKALQTVQEHRAQPDNKDSKENDMWFCREAILTNSIGETLYGAATATASKQATSEKQSPAEQNKSSWKFWSSSSSSSAAPSKESVGKSEKTKTPEQRRKEEEALGWMQKAIAMAQEKSGQHRDCDECAALGLNNLGLISEMEGNADVALQQFSEAILYATKANDYVGIEAYKRNATRLTDKIASASESAVPLSSSSPSSPSSPSSSSPSPSKKA